MVKIICETGYCSGVNKAINKLSKAAKESNKVFLLHPLLHNIHENDKLMKENNASYLEDSSDYEDNSSLLFSAHGYRFSDYEKYKDKLKLFYGTCPIILARYKLLEKNNNDYYYIFLGKGNHEETMCFIDNFPFLHLIDTNLDLNEQIKKLKVKNKKIFFIPQTTISNLKKEECLSILEKDNDVIKKLDICLSYYNRIKEIDTFLSKVNKVSILLIIGDKLSSNANEIFNFVKNQYPNIEVYIENSFERIKEIDIKNKDIFLTSATSTSKENVLLIKKQIENYLL